MTKGFFTEGKQTKKGPTQAKEMNALSRAELGNLISGLFSTYLLLLSKQEIFYEKLFLNEEKLQRSETYQEIH